MIELPGYDPLVHQAAWVGCEDRTHLEISGRDAATFLNNLCTNEVANRPSGEGCEAFFTDVKGRILAHGWLFVGPEAIVFETVAGQEDRLMGHLDRYLIREDVTLTPRSSAWSELYLAGPQAAEVLAQLGLDQPPHDWLNHTAWSFADEPLSVRRIDWTRPGGWLLCGPRGAIDAVTARLRALAVPEADRASFEAARIEAATPWYGQDITDLNLPQEVARDSRAIHFRKGCYLGQETVARIDALGHVNKTLCLVKFAGGEVPPLETEFTAGEKTIGQLTSVAYSPRWNAPIALAYCRRGFNTPGTSLTSPHGPAEVLAIDGV